MAHSKAPVLKRFVLRIFISEFGEWFRSVIIMGKWVCRVEKTIPSLSGTTYLRPILD